MNLGDIIRKLKGLTKKLIVKGLKVKKEKKESMVEKMEIPKKKIPRVEVKEEKNVEVE